MERSIVHYNGRLWLGPPAAMMQQLLDEILKDGTVNRSLKYACKDNAVLSVRWQDLISLITV
jgi:hypothetical protein